MKIVNLRISNFRGIREVDLQNLGSMVVVAGQNGSGKSCVFDSIRLLKSVYGGYQQNEWQQWMGEFQIQLSNRSSDFSEMFNDRSRELRISCDFRLASEERAFIGANAHELIREVVWRSILPEAYEWGGYRMAMFAAQFRQREPEVQIRVAQLLPGVIAELSAEWIHGECFVPVGGVPTTGDSVALAVIFSTFRPRQIGVIDYHGAQRHYSREFVQGINLNLDANAQARSQSTLYNSAAKYSNVKSELASSYLRELLAETAGAPDSEKQTLIATLQELFSSFFPDKRFLGPRPTKDGALAFPVQSGESTHDLDELSAGEKEILYGYLRIRNSAPKYSIILIDEPELHLNPRLIRGLPQFYKHHLGEALGNQIWLVSHSDALLREVVGKEGYDVFHMLPCNNLSAGETQMKPLLVSADLELALVDLVGDLATYRPNGKVALSAKNAPSEETIADELRECARQTVPQLLRHELAEFANAFLLKAINTGTDPTKVDLVDELREAIERSVSRISLLAGADLSAEALRKREADLIAKYEKSLADGSWTRVLRGRDILRRFAGRRASSVSYEVFRNLIVSQMREEGYEPPGMKAVVEKILMG